MNSDLPVDGISAEDRAWDRFVSENPLGHHEQTSMYGALREAFGFTSRRVIETSKGVIVGGAQVLFRHTPIGTFGVLQRGPLAVNEDPSILASVVDELDKLAQRMRAVSLRVQTYPLQGNARDVLRASGYTEDYSWVGTSTTAVADLRFPDDELLARMGKKGRYNARLAQRAGVKISTGDATTLDAFFELHRRTSEYQGFPIFPREYFEYVWNLFENTGRVQQFIAHYDDEPIAGIFNATVGDHMLYGWGGTLRGEATKKLTAHYLLHYEAMRWARDHGCTLYDMLEISARADSGLTRFKTRIAPEHKQWPAPMRKWYGSMRAIRAQLASISWSQPVLRSYVNRVAHRLGHRQKMPW